jgi:signal peptidase I
MPQQIVRGIQILVLVAIAVVASSCGGASHAREYPSSAISAFLVGCESAAKQAGLSSATAAERCDCIIQRLEKNVPYATYEAYNVSAALGGGTAPKKIRDQASVCAPHAKEGEYTMPSSSMEPTIHCARPGSGCEASVADVVEASAPKGDPVRGDIVVFTTPPLAAQRCGAGGKFIKRVIALPGETWQERNGFVYIDGKKLAEPYVTPARRDTGTSYPKRKIPEGMYFMMGDNRAQSCDSREWGSVPRANVLGRVTKINHG